MFRNRYDEQPPRGLLVASTNPLVLKNCQKSWPHILRLDRTRSPSPSSTLSPRSPTSSPAISPLIGRTKGLMLQDEDRRATRRSTTSSRSSSLASSSRRTFDAPASNYSASVAGSSLYSSRSSSPVAELRPQPQATTAVAGSKNGMSENGNGGGGWWGLKSERKRHVKKDEPVWKLVEQKWRAGDCEFRLVDRPSPYRNVDVISAALPRRRVRRGPVSTFREFDRKTLVAHFEVPRHDESILSSDVRLFRYSRGDSRKSPC